jgi:LysM repeat protein
MAIKQMKISRNLSSGNKSFEVKSDIIVPDIKPDIVKIVSTNANTYIYKEEFQNGKIRIDGNIDTYIIYVADNGETRSMQTTLDFIETINDVNAVEGKNLQTFVKLQSIEAKILNERKLSLEASISFSYEITETASVNMNLDFEEIKNAEKLTETTNVQTLIGNNRVRTSVKEDLKVENNISEILKVNLNINNIENKTSYNKVLAKADVEIQILYLTEAGEISKIQTSLPLMSFIDIENVSDTDTCKVSYELRNLLVKINSKEMQSIAFQAEYEAICSVFKYEEITIIKDMYSLNSNLDLESQEISVMTNNLNSNETVNISEKITLENLNNIYSIDTNAKIINRTQTGSTISYEGEVVFNIYYDENSLPGLTVKEIKIPFMVKSENDINDNNLSISNFNYTTNANDLNVELTINFSSNSQEYKNISYVSNVKQQEDSSDCNYNMFLYFVKKGDTIWNIAKNFKVTMQSIIDSNNLENPDTINVGDKLYIMK